MDKNTAVLVLREYRDGGGYYLVWKDGEEEGAWVGQEHETTFRKLMVKHKAAFETRNREEYEFCCVELAARQMLRDDDTGVIDIHRSSQGYVIDSKARALQYRNHMRAALKAAQAEFAGGAPWPDWARDAAANGWVPPKGWKP